MTGFLLDTHVLLWWAEAPERLSEGARLALASGRNPLFFSHASIWEMNLKITSGKLKLPESAAVLMQRARCSPLPIAISHLDAILDLPKIHKDPFDRLLIAQARQESLTLVTRDTEILKYDVMTIAA